MAFRVKRWLKGRKPTRWLFLALLSCGLVLGSGIVFPAISQGVSPQNVSHQSVSSQGSGRPTILAQAGSSATETTAAEKTSESGSAGERRNRFDANPSTPGIDAQAAALEKTADSQYVLEFNRSPIVGSQLRLEGIYNEARLQFTRPRNWDLRTVRILLRYRHSAALYATRSNLNVLVNGSNVGSVPLNNRQGEIGTVIFEIPTRIIQNYNQVIIAGLQNNSPTCTQDPFDPSLWTEILPDSKLVFDYDPDPLELDFKSYPYPLLDVLSLEPNRIDYQLPTTLDADWLTPASRFQASLGRLLDYRPLETKLIPSLDEVEVGEHVVILGTPEQQPILSELDLPLSLQDGQLLNAQQQVIAPEVGVLMWAALEEKQAPVLIATGNGPEGVGKAVQFLAQAQDRQIGSGRAILIDQVEDIESPSLRDWPRYLPLSDDFTLNDLTSFTGEPIDDVTIRGAHAPPFEFDFKALPDDRFKPGNVMTLHYTYGPQINPLTSLVEVQLDGITVAGRRLSGIDGKRRETLKVELPENHITPHSRMKVFLRFDPRERRSCSRVTDHQLWGTIHSDTHFKLIREQVAKLPDLKLLQSGYPFAAPQDLSRTALVLPQNPKTLDLQLLLEVSERLGRLSRAQSLQMEALPVNQLTEEQQNGQHLIAIGLRSQFPFPETFDSSGFSFESQLFRQWGNSRIQTLPDADGLIEQQISPWNSDRVLMTLTAQTEAGLQQVGQLFDQDSLFFQLEGDTALISTNDESASPYNDNAYNLTFLTRLPQREIYETDRVTRALELFKGNWYILVPGMIVLSLMMYGVAQSYLKRLTPTDAMATPATSEQTEV